MKKMNLLVIMMGLIMACNSDDESNSELSKSDMLTGGSSKDWYEAETSYDDSDEFEECRVGGEMRADNTFTFSADGTIEHDNGTITKYSAPDDNGGGCSDLKNYIGQWEFLENETKFSWLIKHEKGNPEDDFGLEPEIWNLVSLTEDELILGIEFNGVEETVTYRAK